MQLKVVLVVFAVHAASVFAAAAAEGQVLTQKKIYHEVISKSPFLVDRTSTIVWTQGPSITDTSLPTASPSPSIAY